VTNAAEYDSFLELFLFFAPSPQAAISTLEKPSKIAAPNVMIVPSAEDWEALLLPEIERQQSEARKSGFRADAAFAKPEIYEALEQRGVKYAIRLPANDNLMVHPGFSALFLRSSSEGFGY